METGEYIRRQATIGDDAADGCHAVHIPLAVVLIRFTTSHAKDMSDETLQVIADMPNVCKRCV